MSQVFERGRAEIEEAIDWDSLSPPCIVWTCKNAGELLVELRHIQGGCSVEGNDGFACQPCFDKEKEKAGYCPTCGGLCAVYLK